MASLAQFRRIFERSARAYDAFCDAQAALCGCVATCVNVLGRLPALSRPTSFAVQGDEALQREVYGAQLAALEQTLATGRSRLYAAVVPGVPGSALDRRGGGTRVHSWRVTARARTGTR